MCQKHFLAIRWNIYWLIIKALAFWSHSYWLLLIHTKTTTEHTHTVHDLKQQYRWVKWANVFLPVSTQPTNYLLVGFLIPTFLLPQMHFDIWVGESLMTTVTSVMMGKPL